MNAHVELATYPFELAGDPTVNPTVEQTVERSVDVHRETDASRDDRPASNGHGPGVPVPNVPSREDMAPSETTTEPAAQTASRGEKPDPETYWLAEADKAESRAVAGLRDNAADWISWLVAAAAGVLSLTGFNMFGRHLQWPGFTVTVAPGHVWTLDPMFLLWVAIDLLAIIAMRQWMRPDYGPESRRLGKWASIGALATSIVINIAGHGLEGGYYWWASIPASAIPPGLLYVALLLRDRRIQEQAAAGRAARLPFEKRAERIAARAAVDSDLHPGVRAAGTGAGKRSRTTTRKFGTSSTGSTAGTHVATPRRPATSTRTTSTSVGSTGTTSTGASDVRVALADLLTAEPDLTQGQLAERLGVTDRTVRRHLSALTEVPTQGASTSPTPTAAPTDTSSTSDGGAQS